MDTGDAIALYAAVVATGAALWPVWQARKARQPPVEVALTPAVWDDDNKSTRGVLVEVRNHGAITVWIQAVGLTDGKAVWTFQPGQMAVGPLAGPRIELHIDLKFPRKVPPQQTRAFVLPENFIDLGKNVGPLLGSLEQAESLALNLHRPLQAWAWLETGHTVATRGRLDWSEPLMTSRGPEDSEEPDDSA